MVGGRGRDNGYPLPPAQTRAGATHAHGSYLGCLESKRASGYGCRTWTSGSRIPRRGRKRCQLQRLRQGDHTTNDYDPATVPLSGQWSGYKFFLVECAPTKNGIVIRYQLAAVPITRGLTGVRAFCMDESGTLFYTQSGSAAEYLSSRKTW